MIFAINARWSFFLVAPFLFGCAHPGENRNSNRPSVILIVLDTLRADSLGTYGNGGKTPNIDRFAEDSLVFERAFANSYLTPLSHMSIFTGAYPTTHGVVRYWDLNERLSPAFRTLPEILQSNGYYTAWFGMYGLMLRPSQGFERGYNEFHREELLTFQQTGQITQWLEKNRDRRFFLFLHSWRPHDPYLITGEFDFPYSSGYSGRVMTRRKELKERIKKTEIDKLNFPSARTPFFNDVGWRAYFQTYPEARLYWSAVDVNKSEDVERLKEGYAGVVSQTDAMVGMVLQQLKKLGLDNTLIILTSDHGEAFLEHGAFRHGSPNHEVLHVPLIIQLPKGAGAARRRIQSAVQSVDILPTVLDFLDIRKPDQPADGRNLTPLFKSVEEVSPRSLFSYTSDRRSSTTSIADGRFKVISRSGKISVYDQKNDLFEHKPLPESAGQLPEVQTLLEELETRVRSVEKK